MRIELPQNQERLLAMAAHVIGHSDRAYPADSVLRQELRKQRGLSRDFSRQVSQLVFTYFRWRGWVEPRSPLTVQLLAAVQFRKRFARTPDAFSERELRQRALPAWVASCADIPHGWLKALQAEPRLWLRARPGRGKSLAFVLGQCRLAGEGILSDALAYSGEEDLFRTPEFQAGEFEIQDLSSQWVGLLCAPQPGETWWDACAGEGGKALHLSDLMQNRGLIWASDRVAWRLQVFKRRAARAKVFNYRCALWDGGDRRPTKTKFDGVLVDAPCSGLGTWHRNPHARWTTTPADVAELSALQAQLLSHAAALVKPGGKLVYSVCTMTRAETIGVAANFEAQFPEWKPLPLANPFPRASVAMDHCWLWPQDCGGNGMFIAGWRQG